MAKQPATPDVDKIRALIALMEKHSLSRLVLTEDDVTVRLGTKSSQPPVSPAAVEAPVEVTAAGLPPVPETQVVPAALPEPDGVPLVSPTTGTFYRAPAPGESPFVEVGDMVEVGQTVGIIMAMKVMSEVPAEIPGEVVAIPAGDAELVQTGTPLVIVRPSA